MILYAFLLVITQWPNEKEKNLKTSSLVKEQEEKGKCVQGLFFDWQNFVSVLYAWTHTKLFSGELLKFRYKVQPKEKALGWWRRHVTPFNS